MYNIIKLHEKDNIAVAPMIIPAHENINYVELGDWAQQIVDTRNAMVAVPGAAAKVWKA